VFTTPEVLLIVGAFAVAAFVQGFAGFGFGITVMSLLGLTSLGLERVSAVVSIAALGLLAVLLLRSRRDGDVQWGQVAMIMGGAVLGMPLGYAFITAMGDRPVFRIALGAFLTVAGVIGVAGARIERRLPGAVAIPVGVLSGFLSGAFVTGGPPIILYLYSRVHDARRMKATVQLLFLIMVAYRLVLIAFGPLGFGGGVLTTAAVAVPACLPVLLLGHFLSWRTTAERFKSVIYVLVSLLGVVMLVKTLSAALLAG
jgi:uncharacterized membrane protein YfcA